jgi:hypothetical protein
MKIKWEPWESREYAKGDVIESCNGMCEYEISGVAYDISIGVGYNKKKKGCWVDIGWFDIDNDRESWSLSCVMVNIPKGKVRSEATTLLSRMRNLVSATEYQPKGDVNNA